MGTVLDWVRIVVPGAITIVLIPLAIYFVGYYWDRRRWIAFERSVRKWAEEEQLLPEDLRDEDWKALAVAELNDAGFEPKKIAELFEAGVWFAMGIASLVVRGRV